MLLLDAQYGVGEGEMRLKAGPFFDVARTCKTGVIKEKDDLVGQLTRSCAGLLGKRRRAMKNSPT